MMKKNKIYYVLICLIAFLMQNSLAQIVTFNSPGQWTTERSDKICVKVQLDTARIPKKKINFTIYKIENGKKKKTLTKEFKVSDYSQEYEIGSIGSVMLGGKDFLNIEWNVTGTKENGNLFPVGIVNLDKITPVKPLYAKKIQNGIDEKSIGNISSFTNLSNGLSFSVLWDPKMLYIVCKKSKPDNNILRFAFDGKNGKNAFISYPDRFVELYTQNDSLSPILYERSCTADTIKYSAKEWRTDIEKKQIGENTLICIPWYDLGIIAQDERAFGFSAFVIDNKNKTLSSYPEKANMLLPGSWSTVILEK
jgi:hypothetical protein